MYELKDLSKPNESFIIDDEMATNILSSIKVLGKHMHTFFFYQIVKRNLIELILFIKNSQNLLQKADLLECNRLLFNFFDTFYSYINFFEGNYKNVFEPIKKELYDDVFEYAFIYNLRNYSIHEDLPILKQEQEIREDYIKIKFIVSKSKLIKSNRIKNTIKSRISNFFKAEDIDVLPILEKMLDIMIDIQTKTMESLSKILLGSFEVLMKYVSNLKEVFILKDGQIINGLLNVANKYYKNMAENFVYSEGLLKDATINKMFMEFSYLYFKERNIIYKP